MATETKWRRRWKPTLAACPWQSIDVDGEKLLIKMKFSDKSYEVLITDLTSFWHESLEEKTLKKRIEKLNPSIEAPITKILDQIKQNVDKPGKETVLSVKFKAVDNGGDDDEQQMMLLTITSTLAGMPFVWKFHASPADSAMARDHLTVPLLAMVSELFRRQRELVTILGAKDKEIDDYKAQGVRASRKYLETTKFDSIAFKNSMTTSKGFEDQVKNLETATFDANGQELYRQIVTKHAWLTHKDSGDGDEEAMSDEESIPMSGQQSASTKQSWTNRLPPSLAQSKGPSPTKTPTTSPSKSPTKSPSKSPHSSSSEATPTKDTEKLRREALERKLEQEGQKKQEKKKKKKLAF
ncbi:hypothetical protein ACOMHN_037881 [Nucella lapillus]